MKKINKIALAISIIGCGISASALAQTATYNPSWYVAPSLNMMDPDDKFGVDDHGFGVGLRFGKPVSQSWDLQLGTSYSRVKDNGSRYQQNLLGVDGLFMFSRKEFRPFLLVGAGYQRDKVSSALVNGTHSSPYISLGLGAQMTLNDRWSLQADYRRVHGYIRDNTFGFDRNNNNYVTVGLNYVFDKPAPAVVDSPAPTPMSEPVAAAPVPMQKPAPRFEKYTLSATELFAFGSDELRTPQPKLDEIATALNNNKEISDVQITGYADRLGSSKFNQKLSEKRAIAVRNYLTAQGVASNRLVAEGKGEANPVVECNDKKRSALIDCLEPNRRVEVEQITIERRVR